MTDATEYDSVNTFVRIRNKADIIDRRHLEKLGISTKRDDSSTIGQFGSGAKLAPIAALRRGIRWVTVAADDKGPYVMEYVSKTVDGIDVVFYKYHGDYDKESSFTVDAGVLSWDEDFQIFREAFSNAIDAGEFVIDRDLVVDSDQFSYEPGYIDVYISSVAEINEVLDNFDQYFCIERTPLLETPFGKIYSSSKRMHSRVFNKGVFVYQLTPEDFSSHKFQTFDWEFDSLELNEERRVKSEYQLEKAMVDILFNVGNTEADRSFASSIYQKEPVEFYSFISSWSMDIKGTAPTVWADVWVEEFGEKAIPIPKNEDSSGVISSNVQALGYTPCPVSATLYKLLTKSGVTSIEEVLGSKASVKVVDCPPEYKDMFDHALRTVARYDSALLNYPVHIMEGGTNGLGLHVVHKGKSEIFISLVALEQGFRTVVETLVHELDHAETGYTDTSRAFRDAADKRIADLIFAVGYDVDIQVLPGRISVPISYASSLGSLKYKILCTEVGSVIDIGNHRFLLDEIARNCEGVMQTSDSGDAFVIEIAEINCNSTLRKL